MNLSRYLYTGPQSAASLRVGKERTLLDVQLLSGQPVELPPDHEYTLALLTLKHLTPWPAQAAAKPAPTPSALEEKGAKSHGR